MEELVEVQDVATRDGTVLAYVGGAARPRSEVVRPPTSNHVADEILQSRESLAGERKQVTVLFADVRGSTLDPVR